MSVLIHRYLDLNLDAERCSNRNMTQDDILAAISDKPFGSLTGLQLDISNWGTHAY
jgi:hypothetical protein